MPFLSSTEQMIVFLAGAAFGCVFITVGVLIKKYRWYQLIAGYNTASEVVKKQYDIEGLAAHIGDGLATLGVFIIIEVVILGVYLHGLAGDFAAEELGRWSLTATDLLEYLPEAFCEYDISESS